MAKGGALCNMFNRIQQFFLGKTDVVRGGGTHHATRNGACLFARGFFFPSALSIVHVDFLTFILYRFHIMHPKHISCIHPLPLQPPPKKKRKSKNSNKKTPNKSTKKQRRKKDKNLVLEAVVWPRESHGLPFSLSIFTGRCPLPGVIVLVQGL